jgi:hypothetical protein
MPRLLIVLFATFFSILAAFLVLFGGLALLGLPVKLSSASAVPSGAAVFPSKIRMGVLGDSDSQSYQDHLMFASDASLRGGPFRATTYQWTEVLARLRGDQIDFGEWGAWGTGWMRAFVDEALGNLARTPPKEDYRYNFAISSAPCEALMGSKQRQARRLVDLMDREPEAWRGGVIVIRSGVTVIGTDDFLDRLARDPNAPDAVDEISACAKAVGDAVALIRERHPDTYIALIGILSNADWSVDFERWQSAKEIANITSGLDRFDNALRKLAATDRHIAFFDDRAWFADLWGTRDAEGRPAYKTVRFAPGWEVTNTSGDDPHNAIIADGHAGVAWNALWAQNLVNKLNASFGLHIRPIEDAEVVRFLEPSFAAHG